MTKPLRFFTRLCVLLFSINVGVYALDSKALESTLKSKGLNATLAYSEASGLKDISFVLIEQDGFWIPLLAHENGKTLIGISPDLILSTDSVFNANLAKIWDKVREHNKQLADKAVLDVFKKFSQNTITLKQKNAQYNTYIVLDANCPYCRDEIAKLKTLMADSNLIVMVVGILQQNSVQKATALLKLIQDAKTQEEQIAALQKVFSKDFDPNSIALTQEQQTKWSADLAQIANKLREAGLQGVPYTIKQPL